MRKLLSTATATCGVALALGMLSGGVADAAIPAPSHGHGHAGHDHRGHARDTDDRAGKPGSHKPGNHNPGAHKPGSGTHQPTTGHKPGGQSGTHKPGNHHPGGHKPGHQPGHDPSGDQGGDQPGGDQPGGDQPGGDKPGGGAKPGGSTKPGSGHLARAASSNPHIIGGEPVTKAPWSAQISWGSSGFQCSGTIIAPEWVMTARHCVDQGDMSVRVGSAKLGEGEEAKVDRKVPNPAGDIALLHLDHQVKSSYAKLTDKDPKAGSVNQIYGWGATAPNAAPSADLLSAKVKVVGMNCKDNFDGPAICSEGVDGAAYFGDSGGPEMADGVQVGVCSTGDGEGKSQQYASVAAARKWIKKTAGV